MIKIFRFKVYYFRIKEHLTTLVAVLITVIILILTLLSVFKYLKLRKNQEKLSAETADLKNKVDLLQKNQALLMADVDDFNQILATLIPDKEDYFTMIAALEKISLETGFITSGYAIDLSSSEQSRTQVVVEGEGNLDVFLNFLKNYHFLGGRLITIDKVDYSFGGPTKTKVNLAFYCKKTSSDSWSNLKVSPQDLALISSIKDKISFNLKTEETGDLNYTTKTNPF